MGTEVAQKNVVSVEFTRSGRHYDYAIPERLEVGADQLGEGDYVVVESPTQGYVVVTVVGIRERLESEWDGEFKEVVDIVHVAEYEGGKARARKRERIL